MALAEASLSTEIDSMSAALTSRSETPGTPSTSISGEPPLMEGTPRMLRLLPAVGLPESMLMLSEGSMPCNACMVETTGRWASSSPEIDETAPVTLIFFCVE